MVTKKAKSRMVKRITGYERSNNETKPTISMMFTSASLLGRPRQIDFLLSELRNTRGSGEEPVRAVEGVGVLHSDRRQQQPART